MSDGYDDFSNDSEKITKKSVTIPIESELIQPDSTPLDATKLNGNEEHVRKRSSVSSLMSSKRKITSPSNLTEPITEEKTPLPDWAKNFKNTLGNYDMGDDFTTRMSALLPIEIKEEKEVLGAGREALYQRADGKGVITEESTSAREALIEYLAKLPLEEGQQEFKQKPTSMKDLLGKEGIKLYEAACAEENNTKAFRDAVFLSSTESYGGPKWSERLVVWVGGPSASGKSFGTSGLINNLNDPDSDALKRVEGSSIEDKNHVVSIDGGKEREMSQMRQMVLQLGLAQGFSGVEDIESYSKNIKTKGFIQKAVLADGKLNMVVPATFTDPGGKHEGMMKDFSKEQGTTQIFAQVRGVPSTDKVNGLDQFKQTVKKMGMSRAFRLKLPDKISKNIDKLKMVDLVKPNNRNIGVESKNYDPLIFDFGVKQSNAMRKTFEEMCKKNEKPLNYYEITNDLVYVKKNEETGKWALCTSKDNFDDPAIVRTNARAFEAYQNIEKYELKTVSPTDFTSEVYVKLDGEKWIEEKVKKGEKPSENAQKISLAGWKYLQEIKFDQKSAAEFDKVTKSDEFDNSFSAGKNQKSIINKGGHPDRSADQKDKNEEKMNYIVAGVEGVIGVELPRRASTNSATSLSASRKLSQPNLERVNAVSGLKPKRRNAVSEQDKSNELPKLFGEENHSDSQIKRKITVSVNDEPKASKPSESTSMLKRTLGVLGLSAKRKETQPTSVEKTAISPIGPIQFEISGENSSRDYVFPGGNIFIKKDDQNKWVEATANEEGSQITGRHIFKHLEQLHNEKGVDLDPIDFVTEGEDQYKGKFSSAGLIKCSVAMDKINKTKDYSILNDSTNPNILIRELLQHKRQLRNMDLKEDEFLSALQTNGLIPPSSQLSQNESISNTAIEPINENLPVEKTLPTTSKPKDLPTLPQTKTNALKTKPKPLPSIPSQSDQEPDFLKKFANIIGNLPPLPEPPQIQNKNSPSEAGVSALNSSGSHVQPVVFTLDELLSKAPTLPKLPEIPVSPEKLPENNTANELGKQALDTTENSPLFQLGAKNKSKGVDVSNDKKREAFFNPPTVSDFKEPQNPLPITPRSRG